MGIAVFDEMKEQDCVINEAKKLQSKAEREKRSVSISPSPNKKAKKVEDKTDNFSFSEFWDVEIVKPLEFDEKKRRQRLAVFILMEMC